MKKLVVILASLVFLPACATLESSQKSALSTAKEYCDSIPYVDRNLGVKLTVTLKKRKGDESTVILSCVGGESVIR